MSDNENRIDDKIEDKVEDKIEDKIDDKIEEKPPKKDGNKGLKIAITILAVLVAVLVGYIITDKMSGSDQKDDTSAATEAKTEAKTQAKSEATTQAKTEAKTEAKSEAKSEAKTEAKKEGETKTKPAVYADVKNSNSWPNGDTFVVQFDVNIKNMKTEDVDDWEVVIPGFTGAKIDQGWSAKFEIKGDELHAKAVDYSEVIPAKGTVNFGVQVIFKSEADSRKVKADQAKVFLDDKEVTETVEVPQGAKVEKKKVTEPEDGTPLEVHGALSVKDTDLVDQNGKQYQLKGISTHGLAWFPEYVNKEAFQTFRDDWGANLIRLAMYTGENGGYCAGGDQDKLKKIVESGVEYATELGMYVIIDWHILSDNDPRTNQDEAIAFFDEMSQKYADYKNVLYEICNEPNGGTTWEDIKEYAEAVIPVIRKNAKDAVIIVGTPTWSQDVDIAAKDPIENETNIMYTLHFYAATHKDNIRNKLKEARTAGLPIFISEFSICDASGNGAVDYDSADEWFQLINDYNLSYAGWNLSNKNESSSLIRSDVKKTSGWTEEELSETGAWLRSTMK